MDVLQETEQGDESQQQKETGVSLFFKVGIIVLSIVMIVGFGVKIVPDAVSVSGYGGKKDLPIYHVLTREKMVALSFDTEREGNDTQALLQTLNQYQVKATFFITGEWLKRYPDSVKAIAAAGHDLGNHSENHKQMSGLSKDQCMAEITELQEQVKKLTDVNMNLFRAPYGDINKKLLAAAKECGYQTIAWDVDSEDWKDYGVDSIIDMTVDNQTLGNGSIVLLHVGTKYTAEALGKIITGLEKKGYEIVPVSQLINSGEDRVDH